MALRPSAIAATALILVAAAAHAAPDPLLDFLAKNRCATADRLSRLFDAGDPARDRDRFLVVSLPGRGYVQCLSHDHETRLLCEASSGFYETATFPSPPPPTSAPSPR